MPPSKFARYALYAASFLSAISVAGHTQMGFDVVFPSLRSQLALNDHGVVSAKIGWLEGNMVYGILGELDYVSLDRAEFCPPEFSLWFIMKFFKDHR
jgi:hypothetical protein